MLSLEKKKQRYKHTNNVKSANISPYRHCSGTHQRPNRYAVPTALAVANMGTIPFMLVLYVNNKVLALKYFLSVSGINSNKARYCILGFTGGSLAFDIIHPYNFT
jgi:hypothetical protein